MDGAYCAIDEEAAYRAMEMSGCSRYVPGAATKAYRQHADEASAIARFQKKRAGPEHHRRIDCLLDLYVRKLAENINESSATMANQFDDTVDMCGAMPSFNQPLTLAARPGTSCALPMSEGGLRPSRLYEKIRGVSKKSCKG